MKKRIKWIDISKGIGILLVIYGHALGGIMNSNVSISTDSLKIPYDIIYGFHMPLFFFLSGIFAVRWVRRAWKLALKQKIFSLVVPYFSWTIITGTIMAFAQSVTNSGLGIKDMVMSPIAPFSEYWFLYVLFIVFIVYYLGERLIGSNWLLVVSFLFFLLRPFIYKVWIFDAFSMNFLFFMLGTQVLKRKEIQEFLQGSVVKCVISLGVFIVVNIVYLMTIDTGNYLMISYYRLITTVCGVLFVIFSAQLLEHCVKLASMLVWLGKASMAIYVMHLIPIAGARIIALKILKVTNVVSLSFVISIIALLTCLFAYVLLKKVKVGKLILGRGLS